MLENITINLNNSHLNDIICTKLHKITAKLQIYVFESIVKIKVLNYRNNLRIQLDF